MASKVERSENIDWDLLGLYMADHVAGATTGIERIKRMARAYADTPHSAALTAMVQEFRAERRVYYEVMDRFDLSRRSYRQVIAWAGEKAGRLKLNGAICRTSPMTPVLESELMRAAVLGKIGGWQTLTAYHQELRMPLGTLEQLIAQAERQIEQLSAMHEAFRARAFYAEKSAT